MACVDDIGADLIAAGGGHRYAISVKTRLFRPGSREGRVTVIESDHLRKLGVFAERFAMVTLLAQVVCLADDGMIHLFLFRANQLGSVLPAVKNGYSIRFGPRHIEILSGNPAVDYSCWREELIGDSWFGAPALEPLTSALPRVSGLHPGAMQVTPDFNAPLPDEFWIGRA